MFEDVHSAVSIVIRNRIWQVFEVVEDSSLGQIKKHENDDIQSYPIVISSGMAFVVSK